MQPLEPLEEHRRRLVTEGALPDPPRRDPSTGVREVIAGTHPRREERRLLAREPEEEARNAAPVRLGERGLVAEPAQRALLAGQRRGSPDAEHDLALQAKRVVPAPVRGVEIPQPAGKARTLRLPEARALERLARRAEIAAPLRGLGQQVEQARVETDACEPLIEE